MEDVISTIEYNPHKQYNNKGVEFKLQSAEDFLQVIEFNVAHSCGLMNSIWKPGISRVISECCMTSVLQAMKIQAEISASMNQSPCADLQ